MSIRPGCVRGGRPIHLSVSRLAAYLYFGPGRDGWQSRVTLTDGTEPPRAPCVLLVFADPHATATPGTANGCAKPWPGCQTDGYPILRIAWGQGAPNSLEAEVTGATPGCPCQLYLSPDPDNARSTTTNMDDRPMPACSLVGSGSEPRRCSCFVTHNPRCASTFLSMDTVRSTHRYNASDNGLVTASQVPNNMATWQWARQPGYSDPLPTAAASV